MKNAGIIGVGSYTPANTVTNDDIAKMGLDTNDEWIIARTGIKERRIATKDECSSDLALVAAQRAIASAGITAKDIELIVVATTTPDNPVFPSLACVLQKKLGISEVPAFDISAACSGFIFALTTGSQFIQTGAYKNVLVVGVDTLSRNLDWTDRGTCILFGDGAGAVVMAPVKKDEGLLAWTMGARGEGSDLLVVPYGGSKTPLTPENIKERKHYIHMDGKAVFKFAVSVCVSSIEECLKKANLTKENIDVLIPHQANKRIIDFARERLNLPEEKVCVNIARYGNTSAASIPLAMDEAVQSGKIKKGDVIALTGFGAGLTWGAAVIRWCC